MNHVIAQINNIHTEFCTENKIKNIVNRLIGIKKITCFERYFRFLINQFLIRPYADTVYDKSGSLGTGTKILKTLVVPLGAERDGYYI